MKINLEKLYYRVILFFPIATLFQPYIDGINKILFSILLLLQCNLFFKKITLRNFCIFFLTFVVFLYDICITNNVAYNINEYFYYPFAIIFLMYVCNNTDNIYNYFVNDKKFILGIIKIWSCLIFVSIFFKSSWISHWGGASYFGSFCHSIWRLVPTVVFISILVIACMKLYQNRKYIVYLVIPMFCFLMCGTRTYLMVGMCLFIIAWYIFAKSRKMFFMSIGPMVILVLIAIMNSSMMDKLSATTYSRDSYFDYWGTITSGRSIFWKADIEAYKNSDTISKLMGNGLNYIYEVNLASDIKGLIWAHNDFIQCLVSHGIIGLIIYSMAMIELLKRNLKKSNGKVLISMTIMVWLINASFNMFYTYFCSILSYPILVMTVKKCEKKDFLSRKNRKVE